MLSADKVVQLFQQAARTEFYIENTLHITLLKVVNNLMMLYIGTAVVRSFIINVFYSNLIPLSTLIFSNL
jgi:hypothetical protein